MMKESVFLFDFDGTLVDSMQHWSDMMLNLLRSHNVSYPDDLINIITPLGVSATAEYFINELKLDMTFDELIEYMAEWAIPVYTDVIRLKSGVREYLTALKNNGYSLNVLTASPHETLAPCLKNNGIYDLFDNVWSCSDFELSKTDEEIYHKVSEALGRAINEIVFFDDNILAIRTAVQAGMQTVGVYDKSGEGFRDELKKTAHKYIESFDSLQYGR